MYARKQPAPEIFLPGKKRAKTPVLMSVLDFRDYTTAEIEAFFQRAGFSARRINNFRNAFRAKPVAETGAGEGQANLATLKGVRGLEALELPFRPLKLVRSLSDSEGNEKFVFRTPDGCLLESVLMPAKENISICVSVQAGCKFNCAFCNTGRMKYRRNLHTHEILDQIRQIYQTRIHPRRLRCVSFMGMGDPFDNLENSMKALDWLMSPWGFEVSRRRVTFSTSGCLPFESFLAYDKLPQLALSLHAAREETRRRLMPAAKIPLSRLKEHMRAYTKRAKCQITVEYCLLRDINDSPADAHALADYLEGLMCKVNVLNYNPTPECDFQPATESSRSAFLNVLRERGLNALFRKSLGADVGAACGQLGGG